MRRRGFTLIELLAVIVVLAIIALIATPIVLNLINNARVGAAEQSATGYVKAIENTIMKDMLNDKDISDGTYKYDYLSVDISGKIPTSGKYTVKNRRVESGNFCINNYVIEYKDGQSKYNKNLKCEEVVGPTKIEVSSTDTHKGIVYLDPTDLSKTCNKENSKSTTETKTGCMKWYIYDEDDNNYTMILDHNTTARVAYNSTGSNSEMKEVKTVLESDTNTWDKSLNARLITANEVTKITGNTSFDEKTSTYDDWFYLDSNNQTQVANSTTKSKYAWLFDYTYSCKEYGCNIEDSSAYGYWTSAPVAGETIYAWRICSYGYLSRIPVNNNERSGIRPVIIISKDIFE